MSRYMLEPLLTKHEVVIGWDRPLANFFLKVRDLTIPEDDEDSVDAVWLGADEYASETNVESVVGEARKWAHVPEDLQDRLLCDQRANPATPLPPVQAALMRRGS